MYESWFAVQKKKRNKIWGKKRWLTILKSDQELLEATGLTLIELQAEAEKILNREQKKYDKLKQNKNSEIEISKDLFGHFLKVYDKATSSYEKEKKPHLKTKKLIQQCAVTYLLKNKLEFANQPEDPAKYRQYRRKKEIQVEQLEKQLKARLPKGRNLTKDEYLEALEQAKCLITENQEMDLLQVRLLRSEQLVPFPVSYNTNTDIYWLKNEQQKLLANQTSLSLLKTFQDFNRPSKHRYQQNPSLAMAVCIGLKEPVTVAVVNLVNGEIIACSDTKQLLNKLIQQKPKQGKKAKKHTQYELFLRRRQQQIENDAKRQQAQTKFADNRFGESESGQYVDRLLAKAIVEMAIQYRVNSIVIPDLKNVREILDSEIQVKAEAKAPGCKKAQKQYAKNYRKSIHRWSYARLCNAIASKANQKGIAIECARQSS